MGFAAGLNVLIQLFAAAAWLVLWRVSRMPATAPRGALIVPSASVAMLCSALALMGIRRVTASMAASSPDAFAIGVIDQLTLPIVISTLWAASGLWAVFCAIWLWRRMA